MKPIIMSTEDVRAILDGRKTMTRTPIVFTMPYIVRKYNGMTVDGKHILDWSYTTSFGDHYHGWVEMKAPYNAGDVLWVRETFAQIRCIETGNVDTFYAANELDYDTVMTTYQCDDNGFETDRHIPWRNGIHMPQDAARLFLRVKDVRVERVQDISPEDCETEGYFETAPVEPRPRSWFSDVWNARNAKRGYGWDSNPWVWVYTFERITKEEAEHGH
jgi:hypothetical protein